LLQQIDQASEFIELISSREKPLVKIRNKKEALEKEKIVKKKRAASRVVSKELQLSWVISQGDLSHKLSQARQYFQKGHVVSIQFAAKQGQLSPPPPDCQKLIDQVHETLQDVAVMHRLTNTGKGLTTRTIAQFYPRDIPGQQGSKDSMKTDAHSGPSEEPSLP
jgi:translation initiation factor IF-3